MKTLLLAAISTAAALAQQPFTPKMTVVQTNAAVCAYLGPILGQPCRQAVVVAIKTYTNVIDVPPEAFKVTLTYKTASGDVKTDSRIALPVPESEFVSAAVTFYLDDITVISVIATPMVAAGASIKLPE